MEYCIYIMSHAKTGIDDFVVTVTRILQKHNIAVEDVCFHFLNFGGSEISIDIEELNDYVRSSLGIGIVPCFYQLNLDGESDFDSVAGVCSNTIIDGSEKCAILVDLVSRPVIMAGICSRLREALNATRPAAVNSMIFYTFKQYVTGDGVKHRFGDDHDVNLEWFEKRLCKVLSIEG